MVMKATTNPFVGLLMGILTTSLVQSSSVTTSMVVGMVSSGALTVGHAVPIIMGANIGTTITNTIVSIGHVTRKREFRRAYAGATIHDIFNLITVAILFPLELMTGYLKKTAYYFAHFFYGQEAVTYQSPIKQISKILSSEIKHFLLDGIQLNEKLSGIIILILSLLLIFFSLYFMVRILRSLMRNNIEKIINHFLGKSALVAIVIGALVTVMVQSSSITTSILVPLVATGIISLRTAFPLTLGANVGTTVTALLAALAGNVMGLTIAFVHLLFNITGIIIIYPIRSIRRIPIYWAHMLAKRVQKRKREIAFYLFGVFYIFPIIVIFIDHLLKK